MKIKICKYWKDYCEPDIGLNEYCNAKKHSCACSGVKKQCNYPNYFREIKNDKIRN